MSKVWLIPPMAAVAVVLASCGASGTQPHDMSAAKHHGASESFEAASHQHARRTDAGPEVRHCGAHSLTCWSTPANQRAHQVEAQRLHDLAVKHRAAGDALARAEVEACAGLSEADREVSPFFHRDDVAVVAPLGATGKSDASTPGTGAMIRFRAVEGLTTDWLARAVECHLARAVALGHSPELGYCPLAVRGAHAKVSSSPSGIEVQVWADDPASGNEILARARRLLPPNP